MNFRVWFHGLMAATISTFATAVSGFIGLPSVFTFDKNGMINVLRMSAVPTIIAVLAYLKQSPVPVLSVTETKTIELTKP